MVPGRPQQYDYATVFESALQLFWSRGFEATSMGDLLTATGLSRSSFYQAFSSKRDLYLKCLEAYDDHIIAAMRSDLAGAKTGRAFVEEGLAALYGESELTCDDRGCMMMNAAGEFPQSDTEIAAVVIRNTDRVLGVLGEAIDRCRSEGDLTATESTEALADYVFAAYSGMITMMKAGMDRRHLENASDSVQSHLFG